MRRAVSVPSSSSAPPPPAAAARARPTTAWLALFVVFLVVAPTVVTGELSTVGLSASATSLDEDQCVLGSVAYSTSTNSTTRCLGVMAFDPSGQFFGTRVLAEPRGDQLLTTVRNLYHSLYVSGTAMSGTNSSDTYIYSAADNGAGATFLWRENMGSANTSTSELLFTVNITSAWLFTSLAVGTVNGTTYLAIVHTRFGPPDSTTVGIYTVSGKLIAHVPAPLSSVYVRQLSESLVKFHPTNGLLYWAVLDVNYDFGIFIINVTSGQVVGTISPGAVIFLAFDFMRPSGEVALLASGASVTVMKTYPPMGGSATSTIQLPSSLAGGYSDAVFFSFISGNSGLFYVLGASPATLVNGTVQLYSLEPFSSTQGYDLVQTATTQPTPKISSLALAPVQGLSLRSVPCTALSGFVLSHPQAPQSLHEHSISWVTVVWVVLVAFLFVGILVVLWRYVLCAKKAPPVKDEEVARLLENALTSSLTRGSERLPTTGRATPAAPVINSSDGSGAGKDSSFETPFQYKVTATAPPPSAAPPSRIGSRR